MQFEDSYLAGIPPTDLTIFADWEAYHQREEVPEAPLSLAGLGTDRDNLVIVEVPYRRRVDGQPPHKKARSSTVIEDEILKSIGNNLDIGAWSVGGINLSIHEVEPDFPKWLYIRKEMLDIFQVFDAQMKQDCNVVFVGTPGVGKSMLVVLFALYRALIQKRRVVLFRGRFSAGFSLLYLDAQSDPPVFWRNNEAAISDIADLENRDFELCLDGFTDTEVKGHFGTLGRFRLLATSAQYRVKDGEVNLMQCLVPFWSFSDLKVIGKYHNWSDEDITNRYFYSGWKFTCFLIANRKTYEINRPSCSGGRFGQYNTS